MRLFDDEMMHIKPFRSLFVHSDIVLCLDVVDFFGLLLDIRFLEGFVRLVVQHNKISITNVESRQMITCVLGVENILVDNKGRPTSLGGVTSVVEGELSRLLCLLILRKS